MPITTFETELDSSPEELFAWHTRSGAFERLSPPWQTIEIVEPAPVENGSRVRLRMKKGPVALGWTAEHRDVDPGRGFTDVQIDGPFRRWIHRHEFEARGAGAVLRDRIDWEVPGGAVGRALAGRQIGRDLSTTFAFRHETTRRDLARHGSFAGAPRLRVAVSGASGLVGGSLAPFLSTGGHRVLRLVRNGAGTPERARWLPEAGLLEPESLPPIDAVVHLAGANVAEARWTPGRKALLRASRVEGTRNLIRSLGELERPPRAFVCASAIGIYGSRGDEILDEGSGAGEGFLADLCREWEAAAREAETLGMRVVTLRFGVVLSPAGGALAKMLPAFRLGAGGPIGDGRQYVSWVSIDDAVGAIHQALLDEGLSGPVNVVAPEPVTHRELAASLGRALRRPAVLPIPEAAARALLGEMADETLLASTRVRPRALAGREFDFEDTDLDAALARLLGKVEMA